MKTLPFVSAFRNAYMKMAMTIKLIAALIIFPYGISIMLDKV